MSYNAAVDRLLNYDLIPDDVDAKIGQAGFVGTTSNGPFSPNTVIADARQRWLFRMAHTNRPLQEKMTLFWHNYFATGYTKVSGVGQQDGVRLMAGKAAGAGFPRADTRSPLAPGVRASRSARTAPSAAPRGRSRGSSLYHGQT